MYELKSADIDSIYLKIKQNIIIYFIFLVQTL